MKIKNKIIKKTIIVTFYAIGLLFSIILILLIYLTINCMHFKKDVVNIEAQLKAINISYRKSDFGLGIIWNSAYYSFQFGDYQINLDLGNYPLFTKYQDLYVPLVDCERVFYKYKKRKRLADIKLGDKNCAFKIDDDDPEPRSVQIYFGRGNTAIKCKMWGPKGVDITTTKEYDEMLKLLTQIDNSIK
ncbi:MAG TPA: hypothetical protein VM658_22490 [bacterium]|nr:hypothetical protein [bacterium]